MTAREYIEAVAQELGKVRGRGLLLSPADAQLALSWHQAQVPLDAVLGEVRRASRLRAKGGHVRGAAEPGISLQVLASAIEVKVRARPRRPAAQGTLGDELRKAARTPGLAARAAWQALAERADELLQDGGESYWTQALGALRLALRELPRATVLQAGSALRARLAHRPSGMSRRHYQRSLKLMLLSVCSERLGVPPRAFLL